MLRFTLALTAFGMLSCTSPPHQDDTAVQKFLPIYNAATNVSGRDCQRGEDCPANSICMKITSSSAKCAKRPSPAPRPFTLPFRPGTRVICAKSTGYLETSHGWPATYFAMDLATPFADSPGTVTAAAAGTAYIYDKCPNPEGSDPAHLPIDQCGIGLGNNVRVDHGGGIISYYAHLAKIFVKTGERVETGQALGLEGATGAAGFRHLHFDVQRIPGDRALWTEVLNTPSLNGLSIPYTIKARVNGKLAEVDAGKDKVCPLYNYTQTPWIAP